MVFRSLETGLAGRISGNLRSPNPALPLQARLFMHSAMQAAVREELRHEPDVVHVALARMGAYLPAPTRGVHRHLDLIDSLSINMRTRAEASRGPARALFSVEARLMERYEARLAAAADSVSLVSGADRAAPGLEAAEVIPNGIDTDALPYEVRGPGCKPRLCFFGNLGYFHNAEPARFVAREVLPAVRAHVPGAHLRLVGARPAAAVRRLGAEQAVELRPDVPDMGAELAAATVAVLPMFSGSGLKNKVLEAFSSGLPVVANSTGMEGIEGALAGVHYVEAESASEFAQASITLLEDAGRREQIAAAARSLVVERYSWETQVQALLDLYGGER